MGPDGFRSPGSLKPEHPRLRIGKLRIDALRVVCWCRRHPGAVASAYTIQRKCGAMRCKNQIVKCKELRRHVPPPIRAARGIDPLDCHGTAGSSQVASYDALRNTSGERKRAKAEINGPAARHRPAAMRSAVTYVRRFRESRAGGLGLCTPEALQRTNRTRQLRSSVRSPDRAPRRNQGPREGKPSSRDLDGILPGFGSLGCDGRHTKEGPPTARSTGKEGRVLRCGQDRAEGVGSQDYPGRVTYVSMSL